jgi:hypothetical protein
VQVDYKKKEIIKTDIEYVLDELATLSHLPKVTLISSTLLAVEITKIDVLTGKNMPTKLFILQVPPSLKGQMILKHSFELKYEHDANDLLLFNENIYYFPYKKCFTKMVELNLSLGKMRLHHLDGFSLDTDQLNSRDLSVSLEYKLYKSRNVTHLDYTP